MFTISYGVGNNVSKTQSQFPTIGSVIDDPNLQSVLGYDAGTIEARVNGSVVNRDAATVDGSTITLVKRAGAKSNNIGDVNIEVGAGGVERTPLQAQQQCLVVIDQRITMALEPAFAALTKLQNETKKVTAIAKRELLVGLDDYAKFQDKIADAVIANGTPGNFVIPQEVKAELKAIDMEAAKTIDAGVATLNKSEESANRWRRNVLADLGLCLTVPEQRLIVAKVLKSDPLKEWDFAATLEVATADKQA